MGEEVQKKWIHSVEIICSLLRDLKKQVAHHFQARQKTCKTSEVVSTTFMVLTISGLRTM
jgi:hypothetical protein